MKTKEHSGRSKRGIKVIFIIVGLLIIAEVLALIWLHASVARYKTFWQNKASIPGEITYLALGDSAAQGIGATSPLKGYVGLLSGRIEEKTGKTVGVVNVSKTGATLSDYLKEQAPVVEKTNADIVTIEIGANDIGNFNPDTFASDFRKVLQTLPDGAFVSNMPLFNSRPKITNNAKRASEIIKTELGNFPKLVFVDLQKETSDHKNIFGFAPDLFHPNNISYTNWANAFWIQIEPTINKGD